MTSPYRIPVPPPVWQKYAHADGMWVGTFGGMRVSLLSEPYGWSWMHLSRYGTTGQMVGGTLADAQAAVEAWVAAIRSRS